MSQGLISPTEPSLSGHLGDRHVDPPFSTWLFRLSSGSLLLGVLFEVAS